MPSATAAFADPALAGSPYRQSANPDSDFIRHPNDYPLRVRSDLRWQSPRPATVPGPGLLFEHPSCLRPGRWLTLTIALRDAHERFRGRVVLACETKQGYQIGVQLADSEQVARLRIVEQFCYMSCYCRNLESTEARWDTSGYDFTDRHEKYARHWVEQFAAAFPTL